MKTIVVAEQKGIISRTLFEALKLKGPAVIVNDTSVETGIKKPDYIIIHTKKARHFQAENGIVIFENDSTISDDFSLSGNFTAIAFQENTEVMKYLKQQGFTTVTCGMSPKSTLTISGRDDGCVSVCINRRINSVLPGECVVKYNKKYDDYTLLAVVAGLLCSCGYSETYLLP